MGRSIVKLPYKGKDYYLLWSSIVDAPITYGVPLKELEDYLREEEGARYMREDHPRRMERVEKYGTSSLHGETPEEFIVVNRAGPDEQRITLEGIIYQYIARAGEDVTHAEMVPYFWPYEDEDD